MCGDVRNTGDCADLEKARFDFYGCLCAVGSKKEATWRLGEKRFWES